MAFDYFTKWVEAASYFVLKARHVARFIENNIIYPKRSYRIMAPTLGRRFEGL